MDPCSECGRKDCDGSWEECPAGPLGLMDLSPRERRREVRRQREARHEDEEEDTE